MLAQTLSFLVLVAAAAAGAVSSTTLAWDHDIDWPLEGVDPNTLSCDPHGKIFLLLPHFTECGKFFMCAHGEEVEVECAPKNLIFDFKRQTCNWPTATTCTLRDPKDEEGSGFIAGELGVFGEEPENGIIGMLTGEASGTVRPVSALTARQFNGIINCNNAAAAASLLPYKGDCQRYWRCVGSVPKSFYCSDGLYFNESTMQCDHEGNVRCSVEVADELNGEFMISE